MRLLLDTHIFLWFATADTRLSPLEQAAIRDSHNEVFLSVVSLWEIIVKHKLGKLPLPEAPDLFVPSQRERHQITSLALDEQSVRYLSYLPQHHRDPFDRMLICQAMTSSMVMMSHDIQLRSYPVALFNTSSRE